MHTHTHPPMRHCRSTGCHRAHPIPPQHPWGLCSPRRSPGTILCAAPGLPTHEGLGMAFVSPPPGVPGPPGPQEFFLPPVMQKRIRIRSPKGSTTARPRKITGIFKYFFFFLSGGSRVQAFAGGSGGCSSPVMPDPVSHLPPPVPAAYLAQTPGGSEPTALQRKAKYHRE